MFSLSKNEKQFLIDFVKACIVTVLIVTAAMTITATVHGHSTEEHDHPTSPFYGDVLEYFAADPHELMCATSDADQRFVLVNVIDIVDASYVPMVAFVQSNQYHTALGKLSSSHGLMGFNVFVDDTTPVEVVAFCTVEYTEL